MRVDIADFLRNTLGGAHEDQSVLRDAIVIPVGRRTTLAMARRRIDATFVKLEKLLLADSTPGKATAAARTGSAGVGAVAAVARDDYRGPAGDMLGTAIGAAVVLLPKLYDAAKSIISTVEKQSGDLVRSAIREVRATYDTAKDFVVRELDQAKSGVAASWAWVVGKSYSAIDVLRDGVSGFLDGVSEFASNTRDSISRGFASTVEFVSLQLGTLKGVTPSDVAYSAEVPQGAVATSAAATTAFWTSLYANIRQWLWRMFGAADAMLFGSKKGAGAGNDNETGSGAGANRQKSTGDSGGIGGGPGEGPGSGATGEPSGRVGSNAGAEGGVYGGKVDAKREAMSPEERDAYRASGREEADIREEYGPGGAHSLPLPGASSFKFTEEAKTNSGMLGVSSAMLDLAARGEAGKFAGGGYNTWFGGKQDPNMTSRTVAEQIAAGAARISQGIPTDAGRWQITHLTLTDPSILKAAGVKLTDRFDQNTQRKIAAAILATTHGHIDSLRGRFLSLRNVPEDEIHQAWNRKDAEVTPQDSIKKLPDGRTPAMLSGAGVIGGSKPTSADSYFGRGIDTAAPPRQPYEPPSDSAASIRAMLSRGGVASGVDPMPASDYFSSNLTGTISTPISEAPVEPSSVDDKHDTPEPADTGETSTGGYGDGSVPDSDAAAKKRALKVHQIDEDSGLVVVAHSEYA